MGIAKDGKYGLTFDRVNSVLEYEPETGIFRWKVKLSDRSPVGKAAGGHAVCGHWRIRVDGHYYMAHRLAWLLMTGDWPPTEIDHKNRVRDDNKWGNLRCCTHSQNLANANRRSDNSTGFKGVRFDPVLKKYRAVSYKDGKQIYAGIFDDPEAAFEAYRRKSLEIHGEFHHSGED